MTWHLLPLLLAAAFQIPGDTPSTRAAELTRARQLLLGTWEFRSIVDNGETLGPNLIRSKVAADGKFVIGERMFQIHTPDGGQKRVTAYRINPSTDPKQIDVITESDKLLKGIYRFDGDTLQICLQNKESGARPDTFDAPDKSDRALMTLQLVTHALADEPKPAERKPVALRFDEELFPARPADAPTPAQLSAPTTLKASRTVASDPEPVPVAAPAPVLEPAQPVAAAPARTLNETEMRRAHQMLYGTWRVAGFERNGETIGSELFRDKISRDGQVVIGNRVVTLVSPMTGEKRISAYRINPAAEPRQIDLITEFDDVKKGIYKFEGNELWICLNDQVPDSTRPTEFAAGSGTNNTLLRLKLVESDSTVKPVATAVTVPAPAPAPVPVPTPEEVARGKEQQIRRMLVGSWTYNDTKGTLTLLLQADGTFTATRYWAKATKRLFNGQSTTSSGRWSYGRGWFRADVTTSEDVLMLGHTYYGRLETVGDNSVVAEDLLGHLMTYRRLQ